MTDETKGSSIAVQPQTAPPFEMIIPGDLPEGRPTKYREEFIQKIEDYIETCKPLQTLPTLEGIAGELKVDAQTLVFWANQKKLNEKGEETQELLYKEFSVAIKKLIDKQKHQLMTDGLYGGKQVNASMAIFLLKANHGMVETTYIDHSSKGKSINTASSEMMVMFRELFKKLGEDHDSGETEDTSP